MKKIIIFLIPLLALLPKNTYAKTTNFFEEQYIENVWMNKVTPDRKTIYYQKARMFREKESNTLAYCIEPFNMFNENSNYEDSTIDNLTQEQKERIKYLVYLGYGNKNKTDDIWYAVTQLLIWQTVEPNGYYYFTDSLNGNKTDRYQYLIDELNTTVQNYKNNTSFKKEYSLTVGEKLEIIDENSFITKYSTDNPYTTIVDNRIIIENLPAGEHQITITKEENQYSVPVVFFKSINSQDLVTIGNLAKQEISITVKVKDTKVNITKLDYDTNSKVPSGNAKLEGAIYKLYDENMHEITQLEIDSTLTTSINSLPIGKYYLKEIIAGEGYNIDETLYEFELSNKTSEINLFLKNRVIKGKLKINKVYIKDEKILPEPNITFNIYDSQNNLYKTATTDINGQLEIELPYGTYKVIQQNTTEGYQYVEPFTIIIDGEKTLTYSLEDYQIEVPNTYTKYQRNKFLEMIKNIVKIIGQIYATKIDITTYIN